MSTLDGTKPLPIPDRMGEFSDNNLVTVRISAPELRLLLVHRGSVLQEADLQGNLDLGCRLNSLRQELYKALLALEKEPADKKQTKESETPKESPAEEKPSKEEPVEESFLLDELESAEEPVHA
jgi:hypothetical protein